VLTIGLASLVGSFTNRMAIEALFDPWPSARLALPYTGVIQRKRREIIDGIAQAVAREIITPDALQNWLTQEGVLTQLRDVAALQVRSLNDPQGPGAQLRARLTDGVRRRVHAALASREVYRTLRQFIRQKAGLAGVVGHVSGLADYDKVTYDILDALERKVDDVLADAPGGGPGPTLRDVLEDTAEHLQQWDIRSEPAVGKFVGDLAGWIDVEKIVTDSLERYSPAQIKQLIRTLSREHLAWLEVYGGLFGAAGGVLMWLLL
jgi:uncharacterized membrane protein YheB (UPF0754 family)